MKTIEIKGTERKEVGKKSTQELRKKGEVPCVLYGGKEVIHFSAEENEFRHLVYTPNVYIVNLNIGKKTTQAIMKEIDFHPVTDRILHIDFYEISEDKKISIAVPVKLNGTAKGVLEGGKMMLKQRKLNVRAFAKDLPDTLNIDVTNMTLGKTKKVGELTFENLELLDPKNNVVATVRLTRSAMSAKTGDADEDEATEETEEGEATEAKEEAKE